MKVTPTKGPVITADTGAQSQAQQARREAVVAKIEQMRNPSAPLPVNPNAISAEDLSAVKPPTQQAQGQSDTSEATQPETPAEPAEKKSDSTASEHVLLARKERALRAKTQQKEQEFKAKEAALAAREAELSKLKSEYESGYISKAQLKMNALQTLQDAGVTYEEVTQQMIDAGSVPQAVQNHISRLEARLAALDQQLNDAKQGAEKQQGEAYNAAIRQIRTDVTNLVKSDPNFETVRVTNSINDVVELIEATYKEEGRVMDVEEATREVEEHLLEEIDKLTRIEKIKKRQEERSRTEQLADKQQPKNSQQQPMKTLTNATSSTRQLSAKERAILAFKGEKL